MNRIPSASPSPASKKLVASSTVGIFLAGVVALFGAGDLSATPAREPVTFLTGPQSGDPLELGLGYVQDHLAELGLQTGDLADFVVQDRYQTRHNGTTHIHLQQRLDGIEVFNGVLNVNVARDGSIINVGNRFVSDLATKVNTRSPEISDRSAIERTAEHLGVADRLRDLTLLGGEGANDLRARYSPAGISRDEIPVRLVYQPLEDGRVRLAWATRIDMIENENWWNVRVDALTGEILSQNNWTAHGVGTTDTYLAVPLPPYSDLNDAGGQHTIVDPADPLASPFGWHDTDGDHDPDFTDTRGNNVNAQEDLDNNNTGGFRPSGGAGPDLNFDYPYDPDMQPGDGTNLEAAIVNLFYANNVMHDLTYQYGFDEVSGNFQLNNYDNGGAGGDPVEADAQDGSGTGNANFSTPPDGFSGRMQMFVWLNPFNQLVTVNGGSLAGEYDANPSNNGGTAMGLMADVMLVDDGVEPTSDACQAVTNDLTAKIALIIWNQGACNSSVFVANAAAAGAVAAIIVDNGATPTTNFGGSPSIPSVAVANGIGMDMVAALDSETVNVTIDDNPDGTINRDSDLDNGIIAHEYGHGISNRLTGGPGNVNCVSGNERAGEGWSDFWTLVLTAKPNEMGHTPRGVGSYVIFEEVNGPGIRNFPYSTDLSVNPQTYSDIAGTNVPHGVGEIWMATVWEMYWELVARYGFDEDLYTGTGGNNLTIQLVVDGMKLQTCNPTFVDARDAILLADQNDNAGANQCDIWRAFAKRGLGLSAVGGTVGTGDEVEAFDIPAECSPLFNTIFTDGFESGDTVRWSTQFPAP